MLPLRMTSPQRAVSASTCLPNASGVPSGSVSPCPSSRALRSGDGERLVGLGVDPVDRRARRAGRREQAEPWPALDPGHAKLGEGRHVRHRGLALGRRDRQRPHAAGGELLLGQRHDVEHDLDVAGDEILQRRRGAPIVHVLDVEIVELLELLARQMARAAEARRAIAELARIGLDVGDQFLRRIRRHRRMHDQDVRRGRDEDDRQEILGRVVGHLGVQMRQDRLRARESPCRACSRRAAISPPHRRRSVPPPPVRFSTTTVLPCSPSLAAKARATMSATPPGASETMILIGCDGYCCAPAGAAPIECRSERDGERTNDRKRHGVPQTTRRPVSRYGKPAVIVAGFLLSAPAPRAAAAPRCW